MSGVKIKADSGGGSVELKGPASTTGNNPVSLKLPVADGSANQVLSTTGSGQLQFATPAGEGTTHVSQWRQNANSTIQTYSNAGNAYTYLTANWEKPDNANGIEFTFIGTDFAAPSSGIFTYPTTGIWRIDFVLQWANSGSVTVNECYAYIEATNDDGTDWQVIGDGGNSVDAGNGTCWLTSQCHAIQDVENVGQDKVKFKSVAGSADATLIASTNQSNTYVTFTRLCDT